MLQLNISRSFETFRDLGLALHNGTHQLYLCTHFSLVHTSHYSVSSFLNASSHACSLVAIITQEGNKMMSAGIQCIGNQLKIEKIKNNNIKSNSAFAMQCNTNKINR